MNEELMQRMLRNKMVPAILSIVLGIAVIITRRGALTVMVQVMGWIILVGAVAFILAYFFGPHRDIVAVVSGLVFGLIGVLIIMEADNVVELLPTLTGIVLILNGLSNIAQAALNGESKVLSVILGILIVVLGVLILARPGAIAEAIYLYIGISFVVNGLFDLLLLYRIREFLR